MSNIRTYVSHSIRGKMGKEATDEYMAENNQKAIEFGKMLRAKIKGVDFYVPGDHDEFVCLAFREGYLDENQILYIDCQIIDTCNFILAWSPDGFISNGMKIEIDHAHFHNIRVLVVTSVIDAVGKINNVLDTLTR